MMFFFAELADGNNDAINKITHFMKEFYVKQEAANKDKYHEKLELIAEVLGSKDEYKELATEINQVLQSSTKAKVNNVPQIAPVEAKVAVEEPKPEVSDDIKKFLAEINKFKGSKDDSSTMVSGLNYYITQLVENGNSDLVTMIKDKKTSINVIESKIIELNKAAADRAKRKPDEFTKSLTSIVNEFRK